jgi:hypothetical protein
VCIQIDGTFFVNLAYQAIIRNNIKYPDLNLKYCFLYFSFIESGIIENVYFKAKVVGLYDDTTLYKTNPLLTQITQESSTNSYIPTPCVKTNTISLNSLEKITNLLSTNFYRSAQFSTSILIYGQSSTIPFIETIANSTKMNLLIHDCSLIVQNDLESTIVRLNIEIEKTTACWPCILILQSFELFMKFGTDFKSVFKDCLNVLACSNNPIGIICMVNDFDAIIIPIRRLFGTFLLILKGILSILDHIIPKTAWKFYNA